MAPSLDLEPFKDLIRARCGLAFDATGEAPLRGAIQGRIQATGAVLPGAYLAQLAAKRAEFDELITLVTINETYFYREPSHLRFLTDTLIPRMLREGRALPLRILSAGSSTGEEPYSIAIALLEKFGEATGGLVTLLAGDIDRRALDKAQAARYSGLSFRSFPPELLSRYFRPDESAFALDGRVRALVRFHRLNLLDEAFPADLAELDVIFCRNVSIYFDPPCRRTVQQALWSRMREGGALFCGNAEIIANDLGIFSLVEEGGFFYFAKEPATRAPAALPKLAPARASRPPAPAASSGKPIAHEAPRRGGAIEGGLEGVRALLRERRWREARERLQALEEQGAQDAAILLLESFLLLQGKDFEGAMELARRVQERDHWSLDACVLLGLAAKWRGDAEDSARWFKQAAYADPRCWVAHYFLGDAHRKLGEDDQARRSYRTVLELTSSDPHPDGGLGIPLGLPLPDIRFLCKRRAGPRDGQATNARR